MRLSTMALGVLVTNRLAYRGRWRICTGRQSQLVTTMQTRLPRQGLRPPLSTSCHGLCSAGLAVVQLARLRAKRTTPVLIRWVKRHARFACVSSCRRMY